ncbi:MAG: hypothetical protein H6673_09440 [Anaerolineales bacterium]|nr:hypothetical protein [Anaerolineales bacterium]
METKNKRSLLATANSLIWFVFPVALITLIGTFQAYGLVSASHEEYKEAPFVTSRAELSDIKAGTLILVQGQVSFNNPVDETDTLDPDMLIYWDIPTNGTKPTPEQTNNKVFPDMLFTLSDGEIQLETDPEGVVIEAEPSKVRNGNNDRVGFRRGDTGMISGEVAFNEAGEPYVDKVTGITGESHEEFLDRLEEPIGYFRTVQSIVAVITVLSGIWFAVVAVQAFRNRPPAEEEEPETDML